MEYSRRPTKSIPKENQLKILNKIYQTYLVSTTLVKGAPGLYINFISIFTSRVLSFRHMVCTNYRLKKQNSTLLTVLSWRLCYKSPSHVLSCSCSLQYGPMGHILRSRYKLNTSVTGLGYFTCENGLRSKKKTRNTMYINNNMIYTEWTALGPY